MKLASHKFKPLVAWQIWPAPGARLDAMNPALVAAVKNSNNATANWLERAGRMKRASARFVLVPSEYRLFS
jgi:hypothetical protein